ncbi:MAG: HNH endonuclease [Candidatus Paceibacterota bacterium]
MHKLVGSRFDELLLFTLTFGGYKKKEIMEVEFGSAPTTRSKSGLTITYTEKGKRKKVTEFVGSQIISVDVDLPDIKKLEDIDDIKKRRVISGSEMILEEYLKENNVNVLVDGRNEEIIFDQDNSEIATNRTRSEFRNAKHDEEVILPEEINNQEKLFEGAVSQRLVNSYERNPVARQKCLEVYGCICMACGFQMDEKYGEIAKDFIHVHHTVPLSEIGKNYEVDPILDLVPLCPNCHAVIHLNNPPFTIDELIQIISKNAG